MSQSAAASEDPLKLFFADFITSARRTLSDLEASYRHLCGEPDNAQDVYVLMRGFHALKGNSSFFDDAAMTPIARAAEDVMERVHESGCSCDQELLVLLERVIARLIQLVDEGEAAGEPGLVEPIDEQLAHALDAMAPFDLEGRYLFWGRDVTEQVRTLAEAADSQSIALEKRDAIAAAAAGLSSIAREADVHDVARSIEAIESPSCDAATVRSALRALSPLLERVSTAD
jgi:chemotaxis protein histidine kinase CheA